MWTRSPEHAADVEPGRERRATPDDVGRGVWHRVQDRGLPGLRIPICHPVNPNRSQAEWHVTKSLCGGGGGLLSPRKLRGRGLGLHGRQVSMQKTGVKSLCALASFIFVCADICCINTALVFFMFAQEASCLELLLQVWPAACFYRSPRCCCTEVGVLSLEVKTACTLFGSHSLSFKWQQRSFSENGVGRPAFMANPHQGPSPPPPPPGTAPPAGFTAHGLGALQQPRRGREQTEQKPNIHTNKCAQARGTCVQACAGQECIRREGTSEAAPEAFRWAVGGGRQSGGGRLLSVTNAIEAGTCRQGNSGRRLGALEGGGGTSAHSCIPGAGLCRQVRGHVPAHVFLI